MQWVVEAQKDLPTQAWITVVVVTRVRSQLRFCHLKSRDQEGQIHAVLPLSQRVPPERDLRADTADIVFGLFVCEGYKDIEGMVTRLLVWHQSPV